MICIDWFVIIAKGSANKIVQQYKIRIKELIRVKLSTNLLRKENNGYLCNAKGALAHLARARHWQCRGERFESAVLHQWQIWKQFRVCFFLFIGNFVKSRVAKPNRILRAFDACQIVFLKL